MSFVAWLIGVFVVLPLLVGGGSFVLYGLASLDGPLILGGAVALVAAYGLGTWVNDQS